MTARTGEPENQAAGNRDIRPVPRHQRTATAWDMASLWVGLVTSVPSYYIAGSLVDEGMAWWQGIAVVFAAEAIILLPLLLAAAPGTRYGVPFPVPCPRPHGLRRPRLPRPRPPTRPRRLRLVRHRVLDRWPGPLSPPPLLPPLYLPFPSHPLALPPFPIPLELACFILFCLAQLGVVWRGIRGIRQLEKYSAPVLIFLVGLLLVWAYVRAGGFGPMLSQPPRLTCPSSGPSSSPPSPPMSAPGQPWR